MSESESEWKEASAISDSVWERDVPIEGILRSIKRNVGPNESNMYMVETKDGMVGVWGSTIIDARMTEVLPGCEVRIEPLGSVKSPKTGRNYLDFKILYREPVMKQASTKTDDDIDPKDIPF